MPVKPPTSEQIRDKIDRGAAGDKVNAFDPAAAPLGSDDEAAGVTPTRKALELARASEAGNKRLVDGKGWLVLCLIAATAVAAGAAILLTMLTQQNS
jgi:hypothetical protein